VTNKPRNRPADGPDTTVLFSYVHPTSVSRSWEFCKEQLLGYDLVNHGRVAAGGYDAIRCGTDGLPEARNVGAKALLESDCDWLFWIDTDMGFPPDIVDRLIDVADPETRPIIGALCFLQKEEATDGMGGYTTSPRATIFDWRKVDAETGAFGFTPRTMYPVNAVTPVGATGSAAILIHRSVFEKINDEYGPCWYDRQINPDTGKLMSEDISFCVRARAVGYPIFVHTGVRTTHHKQHWVSEVDYWRWVQAPPATERVDVIVPTRHRPHNAKPFMESVRASTGLATVYAVCNDDDQESATAWTAAGAMVLGVDWAPGDFARKINVGYEAGGAPWLFLVGDDVRFHPGWLDHAQTVANLYQADVVGTNDLGSPRVMSGEHATHMLIGRDYIDRQGASWDGPGIVCHEGYSHWFVDDEIVWAAKQRGTWAMALGSRVEHLHPIWGKGANDATYELGQKGSADDQRLFQRRARRFAGKVPVPA
jgi:hypothetical protein